MAGFWITVLWRVLAGRLSARGNEPTKSGLLFYWLAPLEDVA